MAKIHTHYDNLKVARGAPQEVIRAAYKALSQKYHPDKNPGDEKAARIMAIVNSAYNILSDPVRRAEHDEWIAAEEWEIAWLESTRSEESRDRHRPAEGPDSAWEAEPAEPPPRPYRAVRDPRWWLGMGACFAAGITSGVLIISTPEVMPVALASALAPKPEIRVDTAPTPAAVPALAEARPENAVDSWAVAKPSSNAPPLQAPEVKALAVAQLVVPARSPDCETELYTLTAPNGEPWPEASGYVEGYPVGNPGEEMRVMVDNTANNSPVFVKVHDLDRRSNVRHVFVLAHESLAIEKLAAGKYEVRYQNIEAGGSQADCLDRKSALKQAAAAPAAPEF
ncbi:J domain-containing protein [Massilia cavernae]|uniref:J domain-containing protein n=1 Tax=Massilia cavernae TaxID=2320864 RepID=A0A418XAE6_9BURK|nr:J domain-containing protein [Massilia cavernae]RJG09338.1 J domain-containing protein [Massilia cavernae]